MTMPSVIQKEAIVAKNFLFYYSLIVVKKLTHRPGKVEWKSDGIGEARQCDIRTEIDDITTQYRCDNIAIGAR